MVCLRSRKCSMSYHRRYLAFWGMNTGSVHFPWPFSSPSSFPRLSDIICRGCVLLAVLFRRCVTSLPTYKMCPCAFSYTACKQAPRGSSCCSSCTHDTNTHKQAHRSSMYVGTRVLSGWAGPRKPSRYMSALMSVLHNLPSPMRTGRRSSSSPSFGARHGLPGMLTPGCHKPLILGHSELDVLCWIGYTLHCHPCPLSQHVSHMSVNVGDHRDSMLLKI